MFYWCLLYIISMVYPVPSWIFFGESFSIAFNVFSQSDFVSLINNVLCMLCPSIMLNVALYGWYMLLCALNGILLMLKYTYAIYCLYHCIICLYIFFLYSLYTDVCIQKILWNQKKKRKGRVGREMRERREVDPLHYC